MASAAQEVAVGTAAVPSAHTSRGRTLATCCGAHALHDGFSDMLLLLFPIWQGAFGLSLTQVGLLKTCYSGAMAGFQLPAGFLAERIGERWLLALGTASAGLGIACSSLTAGFGGLVLCLLAGGMGASVQHPLGSSLISRACDGPRLRVALGTYNFAGDVGKVAVPALLALIIAVWGWRQGAALLGLGGLAAAFAIVVLLAGAAGSGAAAEGAAAAADGPAAPRWRAFAALAVVGVIDNAARSGFLTFLPFVLTAKGVSVPLLGVALGLVFAGGAVGKFVCGLIARRVGVLRTVIITECGTALGMLLVLVLPMLPAVALLPLVGVALNGTSSVLYGSVPELVPGARRARAFALFYTLGIGASALAPALCGVLSDAFGLAATVPLIAGAVLLVVPLTWPLRGQLASD